jgi:hypothetical protein
MGFTIGKQMTAYPPHAMNEQGAPPVCTAPGSVKVGTMVTCLTGAWRGLGSLNPRFNWMIGGSSISAANAASFSCATATTGVLACRLSMGNATWGTWYKDATAGTIAA